MFKVGDRVKVKRVAQGWASSRMIGRTATVRVKQDYEDNVGLEFDEDVDGHDLSGRVNDGYGYFLKSVELEDVKEKITGFLEIGDRI